MAKREMTTTGDELMCSGRVGGYCCTVGTRRGTLVTNSVKGLDYDYVKRNISVTRVRCGRNRMVVGFTTACTISPYDHYRC